jgi:hypothetical protein
VSVYVCGGGGGCGKGNKGEGNKNDCQKLHVLMVTVGWPEGKTLGSVICYEERKLNRVYLKVCISST